MNRSLMNLTLLCLIAMAGISCGSFAHFSGKPQVILNQAEYRDRVYACWLGKNIGGTLGAPFEGKKDAQNITFYTNLKPGEPSPNDDLDLQMLWLKAMEENGGRVDARILGEYWLKYVPVDWNEYGVGKMNMKRGVLPPLSGEFENAQWKHSNGAWIRSEIWACLAPGCPALAAKMAREDACVDHGAAEGALAEIFTASLESAAFIEHDRDKLLAIGLSMIPENSGLAKAIRAAMDAKKAGKSWQEARLDVIKASEETGWFQAPRNVAYTMLGWLYGDDDFGKSLCIAVNCGDDTDCTGATLGSIFGIIHGTQGIPQKWRDPIGTKINTVAIGGFAPPKDLNELTDRTVAMAGKVLARNAMPVALAESPADLRRAGKLKLSDPEAARALWDLSPYRVVWNEGGVRVTLDYVNDPVIQAGAAHSMQVTILNCGERTGKYAITVAGLPEGWRVIDLAPSPVKIRRGKSVVMNLTVMAAKVDGKKAYPMTLQVSGGEKPVAVPLTLIGQGR